MAPLRAGAVIKSRPGGLPPPGRGAYWTLIRLRKQLGAALGCPFLFGSQLGHQEATSDRRPSITV
jgi:hypothetical protein